MKTPQPVSPESDPRFPSGPWTGFFLQPAVPGRHLMELQLSFGQGEMNGEGRDHVGPFLVRGKYFLEDGKCHWTKRYVGKHDVFYRGYNEGKGIWGTWNIPAGMTEPQRGGFHIWPEGMTDPTDSQLAAGADLPAQIPENNEELVAEPVTIAP